MKISDFGQYLNCTQPNLTTVKTPDNLWPRKSKDKCENKVEIGGRGKKICIWCYLVLKPLMIYINVYNGTYVGNVYTNLTRKCGQ